MKENEIPEELKEREQWVCWRIQDREDGKAGKAPVDAAGGGYASPSDPDTWGSFRECVDYFRKRANVDGAGFVFSEKDEYVGIDLDDCRDPESGKLDSEAEELLEKFDTYAEISPSGTGIHIIAKGRMPEGANRKGWVEMYDESRFFTFTGDRIEGSPAEVEECQKEINETFSEHLRDNSSDLKRAETGTEELSDQEIIKRAENAENGDRFRELFYSDGDDSLHYSSPSEADLALCNILAFWTGGDYSRIEQLFSKSRRGRRDKWIDRPDYREKTIRKAIAGTTKFYDSEKHEKLPERKEIWENPSSEVKKATAFSEWDFENILPEEHFISRYIEDYASERTDAYPDYHFGAALQLLSIAVERNAVIDVTPTKKFPNLWINLVGLSTVSRKSTSMKLADLVLREAGLEHKKLADDFSPEALVDELEQDAKKVYWNDEMETFYSELGKNYKQGTDALFAKLYDNPSSHKRKLRNEEVEAEDVYFNIFGACVPRQIIDSIGGEQAESGFLPRMLFIWCERPKEIRDIETGVSDRQEAELGKWMERVNWFLRRYRTSKGSREPLRMIPDEEALEYYNDWVREFEQFIQRNDSKSREISPFFGRIKSYVLKIAVLIELGSSDFKELVDEYRERLQEEERNFRSEDVRELEISLNSVKYSIFYATKLFLPNSRQVLKQIRASETENQVQRVYNLAVRHSDENSEIGHSKLLRNANLQAEKFRKIIGTLKQMNKLREKEDGSGKTYVILDPEEELETPEIQIQEGEPLELPEDMLVDRSEIAK